MKLKTILILVGSLSLILIALFGLLFLSLKVSQKDGAFSDDKISFQDNSDKNLVENKSASVTTENFNSEEKNQTSLEKDCQIKTLLEEVIGDSMSGIVESGEKIKVLENYYQCHPVQRNDIIIYQHPNGQRLIKIVKALPKDKWQLKEEEDGYQILVNDQILTNAQQVPYFIPKERSAILKLYVRDYPVIPENTYLILGNKIEGSLDSTRFGLIDKKEIIGKVILLKSF